MPADLDQFGCEYSDGAVIGRKSLVQLGHMAANGWCLVDQVNFKARSGKVERGLHAADSATDHHDVSEITLRQTLAEQLDLFFLFLFRQFFFHFFLSFKEMTQISKDDYTDFCDSSTHF